MDIFYDDPNDMEDKDFDENSDEDLEDFFSEDDYGLCEECGSPLETFDGVLCDECLEDGDLFDDLDLEDEIPEEE